MTKKLKDYQIDAIEGNKSLKKKGLFEIFKFYMDEYKTITLKAPTGSGKTFIMTKLIEKIATEITDRKICYIWASIGKGDLYKQSYDSIKAELKGIPNCALLTSSYLSSHNEIFDKEIIFINWEKLVKRDKGQGWTNSMMRFQEGRNFIDLLENTKNNGTLIVLIIDESHIGKSNDTHIQKIKDEVIKANFTFEISATPRTTADVIISEDDVVAEGMMKQKLIINKELETEIGTLDSSTIILEKAFNKRLELRNKYEEIGSNVNPLCLIQIPNSEAGKETEELVELFLRSKKITLENGKLVKWMTDSADFDKKGITKNNNLIEFMIFKTVVDTGWDCPRAQILVKFRDVKSDISLKQTIGRILRTPEAKKYDIPLLDNGYLFTNMEYIEPIDDIYNPNRVNDINVSIKKDQNGERIDKGFQLDSFYKSRTGAYNSADSRIYEIVEDEFCNYFGIKPNDLMLDDILAKNGLNIDKLSTTSIIKETERTSKEISSGTKIGGIGAIFEIKSAENEIKALYEALITSNLNGLARARSLSPIKTALSLTIKNHVSGIDRSNELAFAQAIAVKNKEIIGAIINKSTFEFKKRYPNTQNQGNYSNFVIDETRNYASVTYEEIISSLSLYEKMYVLKQGTSQLEKEFIKFLDQNNSSIEWVRHNGSEPNIENFGVSYNNDTETFRPDFIIQFKNGLIGIFDTKAVDYQVEDTRVKAKGLEDYIKNRANAYDLIGGIVIFYNGIWYYNKTNQYKTILEDPSDRLPFIDLL
ncbi:MAG: DEAD/DEAH box helicase family protein [Bacilli bacterium]